MKLLNMFSPGVHLVSQSSKDLPGVVILGEPVTRTWRFRLGLEVESSGIPSVSVVASSLASNCLDLVAVFSIRLSSNSVGRGLCAMERISLLVVSFVMMLVHFDSCM